MDSLTTFLQDPSIKGSRTYFYVFSDGDFPFKIVFNEQDVRSGLPLYLDVFNETGDLVCSFMRRMDGSYTTDF